MSTLEATTFATTTPEIDTPRSIDVSPAAEQISRRKKRDFAIGVGIGLVVGALIIPGMLLSTELGRLVGNYIGASL